MEKFREFFNVLAAIRSIVRKTNRKVVKKAVGDSIQNNRTPTVGQVVRLLERNKDIRSAKELKVVNTILKPYVLKDRNNRGVRRTDAVDIGELTNTYRVVVMNKKLLRREIGRALGRVNG